MESQDLQDFYKVITSYTYSKDKKLLKQEVQILIIKGHKISEIKKIGILPLF